MHVYNSVLDHFTQIPNISYISILNIKKGNCSSAILWSKFILIYRNLYAQNGHFSLQVFANLN